MLSRSVWHIVGEIVIESLAEAGRLTIHSRAYAVGFRAPYQNGDGYLLGLSAMIQRSIWMNVKTKILVMGIIN